jgi:hypothetical protein
MGEMRNTYKILVGKPEEKRSLGRPSRRWQDNIKVDLGEIGLESGLDLAEDTDRWGTVVKTVVKLRVPP